MLREIVKTWLGIHTANSRSGSRTKRMVERLCDSGRVRAPTSPGCSRHSCPEEAETRNHMTTTKRRDDSAIAEGLARWLTHHQDLSDLTVTGLHRPSTGYSSETVIVDAAWSADGIQRTKSLVIRMAPPVVGTFANYDLVPQWQAQAAVA